jgi:hypothetical protein
MLLPEVRGVNLPEGHSSQLLIAAGSGKKIAEMAWTQQAAGAARIMSRKSETSVDFIPDLHNCQWQNRRLYRVATSEPQLAVLASQIKVDASRLTTAGLGAAKPLDSHLAWQFARRNLAQMG